MNVVGASDPKRSSFNMVMENFADSLDHFHTCMLNQYENEPCVLHPDRRQCSTAPYADIGVCGTPCQPFSRQRVKRSAEGSVVNHMKYETTNTDVTSWLRAHMPKTAVLEQVMGLTIPEHSNTTETPLDRQGASN